MGGVAAAAQSLSPEAVAELAEEFPPDAPSEPVEATIDKDHLIVRQTCIKAACEAVAISPLDSQEKAGRITYLAGVFEDWVWR